MSKTLEEIRNMPHDNWASKASCAKMREASSIFCDSSRSFEHRLEACHIFADVTGTSIERLKREYLEKS